MNRELCLALLTGRFSPLEVIGVYVIHGYAQLYMAFNIAHDANHGACSKSKRVNRALGCVSDLVGGNSYIWRLMHLTDRGAFTIAGCRPAAGYGLQSSRSV